MEYPPSPTDSNPSRRSSHALGLMLDGVATNPKIVQFRSDPRFSMENGSSQKQNPFRCSVEAHRVPEQSPLLTPRKSGDIQILPVLDAVSSPDQSASGAQSEDLNDNDRTLPRSAWILFLLALPIGGLQLAWATELSYGSPYLLSLGISKSLLGLVWIAGPLSGTLVQPYIGMRSDRCRSRFGRRRPFVVGGAIATVASLIALAWTREIVTGIFTRIFRVSRDSQATNTTSIIFAVVMIYVLDFSVNVIQAGTRALIVDGAPTHQQDAANAWASRLSNLGNIIGYLFGYADLPKVFWFFGDTQFKDLCVITSIGLLITIAITCLCISERDSRLHGESGKHDGGLFASFRTLVRSLRHLPRQISRVCQVQLAAWIGWFPFLFYATTYIGELYVDPIFRANPHLSAEEVDAVWDQGTRIGTFALMIFAITSFASAVLIPWFTVNPFKSPQPISPTHLTRNVNSAVPEAAPDTAGQARHFPTDDLPVQLNSPLRSAYRKVRRSIYRSTRISLAIPGLTLRRVWMISLVLFALLMWLTFAARNTTSATVLIALVGIPWAVTMWAPFALIAAAVSKRELARDRVRLEIDGVAVGGDAQASEVGLILGIHNVAIAAPQVIATLISSVIFKALQKPRGVAGDGSVAWVLRFGGLCALVAAGLTLRVGEEDENTRGEERS